jgi:tetratricopeptide (TPR) repeat protein
MGPATAPADRKDDVDRKRPPKHEHDGGAAAAPSFDEQLERARAHERAGAFDDAIAAYGDLARLDPTRREPLQGLRRLYAERGSWDAVLQVGELEVGLLAPDDRARLLSQMARIWERELGDVEQARLLLARAQQERKQAQQPVARSEATTATLVQRAWIAAARGDSNAAMAALQEALAQDPSDLEALDMMLTVLEGAERHAEMAELLERRAALATEGSTRAVVLSRLGALRETQQGDLASARSAYERALEADPGNRSARSALQRIYRRTESWPALRALLESAAAAGTPEGRAAASAALGLLLEQKLNDPRGAESAYETARRLVPEDPVAAEGLQRLRSPRPEVTGRGAAADPPARKPAASPESDAPPSEGQEDVETATRPFRRLFAQRPDAQESASALLELHRARGDAAPLVPLLRQELLRSAADQELALQVELSRLLAGSDAAAALPHARRAAALAPRDASLLEEALRTAQAAGGAPGQLDLLDDLLDAAPDLATRAALLTRRVDVLREGLGWSDEAAQCVHDALAADPQHAQARARLATLQA